MSEGGGSVEANWDEVVVLVGVRRWDGRPSAAVRFAAGLAEHVAVLVVAPEPSSHARAGDERLRVVGPRLARVVVPGRPNRRWSLTERVDGAVVRRAVRRALVELGAPDVRSVVTSTTTPVLAGIGERQRVLVVADDLLDGWADSSRRFLGLDRALQRALSDADIVVAGSPVLVEVLRGAGIDAELVPDFVDDAAFCLTTPSDAEHARAGPARRAQVGVVGDLAGDVDLDAIDAVAAAGHDVLLVGRGPRGAMPSELARVLRRSNVEWVGPRPSGAIPDLIAPCRVGLVPLLDTPYTRARLPLDSLVHLAAGRAVVGTACEPVRWLRAGGPSSRHADDELGGLDDRDVAIGADADEVAELVTARLAAPPDPAADGRRRTFAGNHRRSVRAAQLASILAARETEPLEPAR